MKNPADLHVIKKRRIALRHFFALGYLLMTAAIQVEAAPLVTLPYHITGTSLLYT